MTTGLQPSYPPGPRDPRPQGAAPHVLDNPVWAALTGPHRRFARTSGSAVCYHPQVSPFCATADPADPQSWADLGDLAGPGGTVTLTGLDTVPDAWDAGTWIDGVQLVATDLLRDARDPEARPLGPADVPEMLEMVAATQPGPFLPRTVELGGYYGIRRGGRLVAMAGERFRPPGHTEISAVCTDPEHRGQGLATRLIQHAAAGIRARGEVPFLHAAAVNTGAIALYESIGFVRRREVRFWFGPAPLAPADAARNS